MVSGFAEELYKNNSSSNNRNQVFGYQYYQLSTGRSRTNTLKLGPVGVKEIPDGHCSHGCFVHPVPITPPNTAPHSRYCLYVTTYNTVSTISTTQVSSRAVSHHYLYLLDLPP